ncbi:MAG: tyrosine recombinase [Ruminococcaceae bacterium]|nr:tyrosine recombinase [Oscillospiraceae bacterium]
MSAYIKEFSSYLVETKAVAPNTLESYRRDVGQFLAFLLEGSDESEGFAKVTESDSDDVREFIDHLREMGKSTATITRMLASVRSYYQFLMFSKLIDNNPAKQVKVERVEKKIPHILSDSEVLRLLNAPNANDLKGARDKSMLELLYATGIRVSELINLDVSDVKCEKGCRGEVYCSGKNPRTIPMHVEAANALHYYINNVRPLLLSPESGNALFINLNGSRLSRQGFWKIVKTYAEIANISGEITPHTLRHSFAMHLYQNGASLHDLQVMLGHSDISSTQLYANMSQMNRCKDVYDRCHPLSAQN